jgi:HPt (histidine-containing phosphotransfer) domain-containing protein
MPSTEIPIESEIEQLVPQFLSSRRLDYQRMSQLIELNDYDQIQKMSHTIVGIARPYGFPTLELMSQVIEKAAKEKNMAKIKEQQSLIAKYLEQFQ